MPVLFIGHGSPINAIENNEFSAEWRNITKSIPKPKAIICISAHWLTDGSFINDQEKPKTIYDFYGFPDELYSTKYNAPGAPDIAQKITDITDNTIKIDNSWGIDHGTWSVLNQMYPATDIPVTQISINRSISTKEMFNIGQKIKSLRQEGVLIIGSGNIVHNLYQINPAMDEIGYKWADEFDQAIKKSIEIKDINKILDIKNFGDAANLSMPTIEHFLPLVYVLGAANIDDIVTVYNEKRTMGSLSMTCYRFDAKTD